MLWVALFDNSTEGILTDDPEDSTGSPNVGRMPEPPVTTRDILVALGESDESKVDADADALRATRILAGQDELKPPSRPVSGYVLFVKNFQRETREELGPSATPDLVAKALSTRWANISDGDRAAWNRYYDTLMQEYNVDLAAYNEAKRAAQEDKSHLDRSHTDHVAVRLAQLEEQLSEKFRNDGVRVAPLEIPAYAEDGTVSFPNRRSDTDSKALEASDYHMTFSADAGAKILESGKAELMKRLENYPDAPEQLHIASPNSPIISPASPVREFYEARDGEVPRYIVEEDSDEGEEEEDEEEEDEEEEEEDEEEEEEEEEESEEDEYPGSTEDGRGLLTDVPLILGPSEIEVLPMIVMSGIVPPPISSLGATTEEINAIVNMHTVRCHLLLAQDNGKNLLRELLIFVAAWDLREEELYFKFMVKIMEAILCNGLMPFAYHAFRDKSRSKDIISPAQAVIMKLLTNIFRSRAEAAKNKPENAVDMPPYPMKVDVHIVNFIFTEFRQHIIPQTCALIFLQGKIHQNLASPEDFPLNLWDMERMYEGVYQYLEFFAVLTEESIWKDVMAEWEVASELVTLLKELEAAIPKLGPGNAPHAPNPRRNTTAQHAPSPQPPPPAPTGSRPPAVSVERPFDLSPELTPALPPLPPLQAAGDNNPVFEAETPLAYPEDPQDEPSDFEWRNLKKLTVLVLSSLIWKNKKVQDQVREYGGLEALVGCCRHDEHNPYIREHAIMCLRFAVEGNEANAKVIKKMAGLDGNKMTLDPSSALSGYHIEGTVPQEVLDTNGYETFMDGKGQVGLRRKDNGAMPGASYSMPQGPAKPKTTQTKMTAEKAAELMQTALRDLPLGDKILGDKEQKETIAKLDRAFEQVQDKGKGRR